MLAKKIAYNTIVSVVSRLFATVLAVVIIGFITRYLGQEGFGQYSTILAYLYIFSVLADLGLYSIAVREISKEGANESQIAGQIFSLRFWAGFFIFSLSAVIVWLLPYSFEIKAGTIIAAFGFWFLSNSQVLMAIFQKHLKTDRPSFADLLGRIIQVAAVAFIIWKGLGFFAIVLSFSLSSFVNFILVWFFARRYVTFKIKWDVFAWKKVLKESYPLAASAIFVMIYFKLDTVMLSLMKPAQDVGIYGVAYKILESLIFFPAMFVGLIMPLLSKYAFLDRLQFKKVAQKAFDILLIFAAPLAVGGIFLSGPIIKLVTGRGFEQSAGVLNILVVATAVIFFGALFSNMIVALGKQKALAKIYALGAVVNFSVNLVLIPKFSYWGAASSTLLTEILVTFLMLIVIKKTVGFLPGFGIGVKTFLATIAMGFVLYFLSGWNFFAVAFAGAAVYFLALFLVKAVSVKEVLVLVRKQD